MITDMREMTWRRKTGKKNKAAYIMTYRIKGRGDYRDIYRHNEMEKADREELLSEMMEEQDTNIKLKK